MSGMLIGASLQGDAAQGILRSAPQTLLHILRTQGLPGLWIGIGPSVIRLGAGVGLHMCLVENLAAALSRPLPAAGGGGWHIPPLSAALASGSSRALSSVLLCPLAVAKTRMEYAGTGAVHYRDTLDALATIARSEGPRALFRGLLPTIVTNAPFSGLYYMFYIRLKEQLSDEHRPKVLVNLSSGVLAAIAATVLTQPFDVLRTRLQLSRSVAGASGRGLAAEMVNALQSTLKQGVGSLFVGTWPRVLKRTAQTALVWTLYEELAPRLTALFLGIRTVMFAKVQQLQQH